MIVRGLGRDRRDARRCGSRYSGQKLLPAHVRHPLSSVCRRRSRAIVDFTPQGATTRHTSDSRLNRLVCRHRHAFCFGLQRPGSLAPGPAYGWDEPAGMYPPNRRSPAMVTHGEGPKDVLVRSYGRWRRGRYERVRSASRGSWHRLRLRFSPHQLHFGFWDD